MGSQTHPLRPEPWQAWKRQPVMTYAGLTFMQCPPLFTHQYPQVWFDLRGLRDEQADYFRNSQLATIAQRQWTIDELTPRFRTYGPNMWGLSASDMEGGYVAWGGPPVDPRAVVDDKINGSVTPHAAAGSLAFEPRFVSMIWKTSARRTARRDSSNTASWTRSIPPTAGTTPTYWELISVRPS